jgi:hypothetical protein
MFSNTGRFTLLTQWSPFVFPEQILALHPLVFLGEGAKYCDQCRFRLTNSPANLMKALVIHSIVN